VIRRFRVPYMSCTRNGGAFGLLVLSAEIMLNGCAKCTFWLLLTSQSFDFLILSDTIKVFSLCVVLFESFGFFIILFDSRGFFVASFGSFNFFSALFNSSRLFASSFN